MLFMLFMQQNRSTLFTVYAVYAIRSPELTLNSPYIRHGARWPMRDVRDVLTPGHAASTRLVRATRHFVASVPYAKHTKGRVVIAPKWHVQRFEDALGRGAGRPRRAAPAGHGRRLRAGERASRRGAQTLN
jgi:hypothetical protein